MCLAIPGKIIEINDDGKSVLGDFDNLTSCKFKLALLIIPCDPLNHYDSLKTYSEFIQEKNTTLPMFKRL